MVCFVVKYNYSQIVATVHRSRVYNYDCVVKSNKLYGCTIRLEFALLGYGVVTIISCAILCQYNYVGRINNY